MVAAIIIGMCLISFLLFTVFLCICLSSIMGCLKFFTPFLSRILSAQHDQVYSSPRQPINRQCFICLEPVKNQVVATCNHSYCGQCIMNYIDSQNNQEIRCPACRKQILVLFRRFQPISDEQKKIKEAISAYNYKFTKQPTILRAITEFGNTFRNVPILFSTQGISYVLNNQRLKYLILLAIYTFSPFDLLPQAVLGGIGLLDDGVAVAGMARQISSILYGFVREEMRRNR